MEKIIYTITKVGKKENQKLTGVGYINDNDIIIACTSKSGKPFVKVLKGALQTCQATGTDGEYKGAFFEKVQMDYIDVKGQPNARKVAVDYLIWFKKVAD